MKNIFPGFYSPSEEELDAAWKNDDTLFVFDTNTLLNLYGYASQTRDDFFSILNVISERIWIPYHVGLEYQRRRLCVIRDEKAIFKKIEELLSKLDNIFESEFSVLALNRRFPALFRNTEKLHSDIKKLISAYKKSLSHWDKNQLCVRGHDDIREKLTELFDGKVGKIPESQEILEGIYKEGGKRYRNKVPPGYKDAEKSNKDDGRFFYSGLEYDSQYGDLLIWKQLIEKVKQDDIKSVVFITDDAKEDWWYLINSRGEKSIGPRAELREEICGEGNIELFTMYNTSGFLDSGKKLLAVDVKDESINDARKTFSEQARIRKIFESTLLNDINKYGKTFEEFARSQSKLKEFEKFKSLQKSLKGDQLRKLGMLLNDSYSEKLKDISISKDKLLQINHISEIEELKDSFRIENDSLNEEDNEDVE